MTPQQYEQEIRRLKRRLCCCPNNCPLSQRTYLSAVIDPLQDIAIGVTFNGGSILSTTANVATALANANAALLGLAVFTLTADDKIKMVTSICGVFTMSAVND